MFKSLLLSLMVLLLPNLVEAQATSANNIDVSTVLSKVTLNQGVMYGVKANSFSYTMTTDLVTWKGFSIIGGYSSAAKAVAGIDYDLLNLKGVNIPLLKFFDIHIGYGASWDNIGGRNVVDHGPVVTLANIQF